MPRAIPFSSYLSVPSEPSTALHLLSLDLNDMPNASLLDYVRQHIIVDVDSMNPQVAARSSTENVKFCDMTSNQAIVFNEATNPSSRHVFEAACQDAKSSDRSLEDQVTDALDILVDLRMLRYIELR